MTFSQITPGKPPCTYCQCGLHPKTLLSDVGRIPLPIPEFILWVTSLRIDAGADLSASQPCNSRNLRHDPPISSWVESYLLHAIHDRDVNSLPWHVSGGQSWNRWWARMSYRMKGGPLRPQIIADKWWVKVSRFVEADGFVSDRVGIIPLKLHTVFDHVLSPFPMFNWTMCPDDMECFGTTIAWKWGRNCRANPWC